MVAGPDSCSCPECEVVCPGRFPGCSVVWARGPRVVEARRDHVAVRTSRERPDPAPGPSGDDEPVPEVGTPLEPAGREVSLLSAVAPLAQTEYHAPAASRVVELVALHPSLEQVKAELRALAAAVQRQESLLADLAEAASRPDPLGERLLDQVGYRARRGLGDAAGAEGAGDASLAGPELPPEAMGDMALLLKELVVRLERLEDRIGSPRPAPVPPTMRIQPAGLAERLLPQLSADIQSSVSELSDRLEREVQARLAVLQRELAAWLPSPQGDNGRETAAAAAAVAVAEELLAATARRERLQAETNDFLVRVAEQLNHLTDAVVGLRRRLG